jgi:hypothetical protein
MNKVYALKWELNGEEGFCSLLYTEDSELTPSLKLVNKMFKYLSKHFPETKYTTVTYVEQK